MMAAPSLLSCVLTVFLGHPAPCIDTGVTVALIGPERDMAEVADGEVQIRDGLPGLNKNLCSIGAAIV